MLTIILTCYVITTVGGLVSLKYSANNGKPAISLIKGRIVYSITPITLMGISLYALSFLLYIYLVSAYELGYIIPLAAAAVYTVLFTTSYYVLSEVFTFKKSIALVMMVIGIILLGVHGA